MRAVISLGSNSTRLLVVEDLPGGTIRQVEHDAIGTRLSEGMPQRGPIAGAARRRTLDAVARFAERVRAINAAPVCIATSAMRRATDGEAFAGQVQAITGVPVRILSGPQEAECSFTGATHADQGAGRTIAVLDVGGGSAECAVGRDGVLAGSESVEIGAVGLAERYPDLMGGAPPDAARRAAAAARADAAGALVPLARLAPVDEMRIVGGTARTLGAIARAPQRGIAGCILSRAWIDGIVDGLLELDLEARRAVPGMVAQRADIVPAGAIVITETMRLFGSGSARVEVDDLLLGYALWTKG